MAKLPAIGLAVRHMAPLVALSLAAPALADVKAGVDAWSRSDFKTAVSEWEGPAGQGDPDAMFNLGQAYRLGLGVEADPAKAEYYYSRAAQAGHVRAADTYGLILFQSGRTTEALPYLQAAADRGDPRSQYLLGVAHFNGDIVSKDWVKAYALVSLASQQGLPQAAPALAQMEQFIPVAQRTQGASLAQQMKDEEARAHAAEAAQFDLAAVGGEASAPGAPPVAPPAPPPVRTAAPAPLETATPRVPQPIEAAEVPPSLAEARDAVRQAMLATGTEDPGEAGADYARPDAPERYAAAKVPPPATPAPAPKPAPKPAPTVAKEPAGGPWKLQLGAFGVAGNADKLWAQLSARPELAGKQRLLVSAGKLTKLLAGGFATRAEAEAACGKLKAAGQACIVTQ